MNLKETQVETTTVFTGKIVTVLVDKAELPNGKIATREVVRHPGGVAVLALSDDNMVTLVRQYRYPIGQELLELPAGKLDLDGESVETAAIRELGEETGLVAEKLTYLGYTLASPGFCDEALHMYLAQGLSQGEVHPDEDEFLNLSTMPFDTLVAQIMSGEITDAKTVSTTLKVKTLLKL